MIPGKSKRYHKWKVGTINIQSCSDDLRLDLALQECVHANLDIICFQEVRRLNSGSVMHLGYSFYWNGLQRKRQHGVAIAIRKNSNIIIETIHYCSARLMAADLTIKGCKVRIVSCYAPVLKAAFSTKQNFYREMSRLCRTEKNRKLLIQGDFNAEPQICRSHSNFEGGKSSVDEGTNQSNENAMLFIQFCHSNELSILNTWFEHPIKHRVTWHHPNGFTKKVYDYSLSRSWLRQHVLDVRVRNSYFHSDHRLVVTRLQTPANKAARHFQRKTKTKKPNLKLLQDETYSQNIRSTISNYFEDNTFPTTINEMHSYIINGLKTGRNEIPVVPDSQQTIPWNLDNELAELILNRKELRKQSDTTNTKAKLKEITKKIKRKVKTIRNNILKTKGKNINEARQTRQIAKMWKIAKNHDKTILKKPKPIQCPGLSSHFSKHFNPDHTLLTTPEEIEQPPDFIKVLQDCNVDIIRTPPTSEEINKATNQLNSGKSATDIESEVLKCAQPIPQFKDCLEQYFHLIWTKKEIPDQWRISRITPIWKNKGSANDPTKYRGISIGSTLCKVGMNIILNRLSCFYEQQLKDTQYGFRHGTSCNDGIFVVKQLHEIAILSQRELFVCFVDLSSAFDHVNRKLLFKTLKNRLPQNHTPSNIDIIENLYQNTRSYMQNDNPATDAFVTESGVRQGGVEGPPLYNLYSDYALRVYEDRKTEAGAVGLHIPYEIPQEATNREQRSIASASGTTKDDDVGYADDLALFSWSAEELQICINILVQVFKEFGLIVNSDKTETVVLNWQNKPNVTYPETIISMNGVEIKNPSSFKYLGVWISQDTVHIGNAEMNHRIGSAHNAFSENRKLLTNYNIQLQTRIMFLNALVRTRLTYGCHCWRPTTQELGKLESTYRYFLRCMVFNGQKRVNPPTARSSTTSHSGTSSSSSDDDDDVDWRYVITNNKLYDITHCKPIKEHLEKLQHNWLSHVVRRPNTNLCKQVTFHNVKRIRRGRKSPSILEKVIENSGMTKNQFLRQSFEKRNRR